MAIARQTRIFVPSKAPFDDRNWAESVFGRVIAPLTQQHYLDWFWFSRYCTTRDDSGDCDIDRVPENFGIDLTALYEMDELKKTGTSGFYRSIRFRYSVEEGNQEAFETAAQTAATRAGCVVTDFRDYDWIGDLGGGRFCPTSEYQSRQRRAQHVVILLLNLCELVLECLVPLGDGKYRLEENCDSQNPNCSTFESIHHLFCNITEVPTEILMFPNGQIGTRWTIPPELASMADRKKVRF